MFQLVDQPTLVEEDIGKPGGGNGGSLQSNPVID